MELAPIFVFGFIVGFYFSIIVLDRLYKESMKRAIDEIHEQYLRAIEILKGDA